MSEKVELSKRIIKFLNPIFKKHGYKKDGQKRWRLDKGAFSLGVSIQPSQWGKQYYVNLEMTIDVLNFKNGMFGRMHPEPEVLHGGAFDFEKLSEQKTLTILGDQLESEILPLFGSVHSLDDLKKSTAKYPMAMAVLSQL